MTTDDNNELRHMVQQLQQELAEVKAELQNYRAGQAGPEVRKVTKATGGLSRRRLLQQMSAGAAAVGGLTLAATVAGAAPATAYTPTDNAIEADGGGNGYGGKFSGGLAPLLLVPSGAAGAPAASGHQKGELFVSGDGKLYFFDGTNWVYLNGGGGSGGSGPVLNLLPSPDRFIDTRGAGFVGAGDPTGPVPGFAPAAPPPAANIRNYTLTGRPGQNGTTLPTGIKAVTGNLTVVTGAGAEGGYLLTWPKGGTVPKTSTINFGANAIVANSFICGLSADGKLSLAAYRTTDVIIDIVGYYA